MKEKNIPNNYNSLSVEELTNLADKMIKDLENQKKYIKNQVKDKCKKS